MRAYSIASFWLLAGAWDKAYEWTQLTASERTTIKSQYSAAGIKLMVAAFGSTDVPTTTGADPVGTANNIASFVKQWGFDGVDIDYEVRVLGCVAECLDADVVGGWQDFGAMDSGTAENWLISFTKQLRSQLPSGQYIITHARESAAYACSLACELIADEDASCSGRAMVYLPTPEIFAAEWSIEVT